MLTGIDHLVIACADPDAAAARLERAVGLRATGGGRHDALGTFNRLVWLGDSYLELIGVFDARLAAASWVGRPTLRALERGGGLATYALASDDLAADVARLRAAAALLEGPLPGERIRPDGRAVRWRLAAPAILGPREPGFLIQHDETAAEWTPSEREARAAEAHPAGGPVRLVSMELPVPDLRAAMMSQLRTLGLQFRPSLSGRGARDASLGSQILRLRPQSSGNQAPTITLRVLPIAGSARDGFAALPEPIEALGCRWAVLPAG